MKYVLAGILSLFSCAMACGQDLSIQGDTKIVKIDRVIIVKDDKTVVSSLPFTVQAPPNAGLYFWSFPSNVIATDLGDSLKVTNAPMGDCTISVKMITADVKDEKFKGFITKFLSISFAIGDVTPPKPPIPPTPVDPVLTPLQKQLKPAVDADADPVAVGKFADVLLQLVPAAETSGKIKTAKELVALGKTSTDIAIGPKAAPKTRAAVGAYLSSVLPREADTPADEAYWTAAEREHALVGNALKGLVK